MPISIDGDGSKPDLFSFFYTYKTAQVVRIKSKWLTVVYYSLITLILVYVIGYTFMVKKRYLVLADYETFVRASWRWPEHRHNLTELPYCAQSPIDGYSKTAYTTGERAAPTARHDCVFWDAAEAIYPAEEVSASMLTTRVSISNETLSCDQTEPNCEFDRAGAKVTRYIAEPERFTVLLDHAVKSPDYNKQAAARLIHGEVLGKDGQPIVLHKPSTLAFKYGDILELDVLLRAAGIDSLDEQSLLHPDEHSRSKRFDGIVLLVNIHYTNLETFDLDHFTYTYSVRALSATEYKVTQIEYTKYPSSRIVLDRHGVRIMYVNCQCPRPPPTWLRLDSRLPARARNRLSFRTMREASVAARSTGCNNRICMKQAWPGGPCAPLARLALGRRSGGNSRPSAERVYVEHVWHQRPDGRHTTYNMAYQHTCCVAHATRNQCECTNRTGTPSVPRWASSTSRLP